MLDHHFDRKQLTPSATFVLALALTLVVGGIGYAYLTADRRADVTSDETPSVPTEEEYRTELILAARPFLEQASVMTSEDILSVDETAVTLAEKTRERVIGIVAPSREDVQLMLVLLLDRWIRAFRGDAAEIANVHAATEAFLTSYPWLLQDGDRLTP